MCILFIEQKCSNGIGEIGFDNSYSQYSLGSEDTVRLQEIIKWYFGKIEIKFPMLKYEDLQIIKYANGKNVMIPKWYLETRGHEIGTKLRMVFPSLEAFKKEGELQTRLSEIAGKCYPFVPLETLELLSILSNK